jgi:hypothetical protein
LPFDTAIVLGEESFSASGWRMLWLALDGFSVWFLICLIIPLFAQRSLFLRFFSVGA